LKIPYLSLLFYQRLIAKEEFTILVEMILLTTLLLFKFGTLV